MSITSGAMDCLPKELLSKLLRYRHKVFIDTLGWKLNTENGAELDQFDRSDTVYVIAQDHQGNVNGCARLLPTNRPYLLGEVFPQLLHGLPPPESADVWELSRFAALDFHHRTVSVAGAVLAPVTTRLLQESICYANAQGAKKLITVSTTAMERLMRKAAIRVQRAGPPMMINGYSTYACWIEC
ncbi:acyl-homoserine-lactone synthase [Glaciimonas sp. GG7]